MYIDIKRRVDGEEITYHLPTHPMDKRAHTPDVKALYAIGICGFWTYHYSIEEYWNLVNYLLDDMSEESIQGLSEFLEDAEI